MRLRLAALFLFVGLAEQGAAALRAEQLAAENPKDAGAPFIQRATDSDGQPLPPGALARLGTTRLHDGVNVLAVAYSPDGRVIASGGGGNGVRLWDAATGKLLRLLHRGGARTLAYSTDGKWLATEGNNGIEVWDPRSGARVRQLRVQEGSILWAIAFSPDGKKIAAAEDKQIRVWDTLSGAKGHELSGDGGAFHCVAFSPDGTLLAAAGSDKGIHLWDAATAAPRGRWAGHSETVRAIAFSPDGKWLASGGEDETVRLWDVAAGRRHKILGASLTEVKALVFSPGGQSLATGHFDGAIRLWDLASGKQRRLIRAHGSQVAALAFSPDGTTLVSGSAAESALRRWDPLTGQEWRALGGPRARVTWLAFSDDSRSLFLDSADQTLRRWDWVQDSETILLSRHGLSRDGGHILTPDGPVLAFDDHPVLSIRIWGPNLRARPRVIPIEHLCEALALSSDGRRLVSAGRKVSTELASSDWKPAMYLWDVATGKQVRKIDGLIDDVSSVVFCPDGKAFLSSHQDRNEGALRGRGLRLWDSATGKELREFNCTENVRGVYFSPNGKLLTGRLGSRFSRPCIWDMTEGKEYPLLRLSWKCGWGGFSPDSKLLVLDCIDPECALELIEVASGETVRRFPGIHDGWVSAVAFSADGTLMATGGGDSTVLVWDLTGRHGTSAKRAPVDVKKCWTDLAGLDATQAYTALWDLAAVPEQAVPFLREQLHPLPPLDETQRQKVQQWLADLESEDFARRRQALKELQSLGPLASPALRAALKGRPSLEARRQIEQLLKEPVGWSPERLRLMRAVMALEHMGTTNARRLLEDLARGAPQALVMREAQAALERMVQRRTAP